MALKQLDPIYALEPVMHKGEHFEPGEQITDVDENDIGSILSSGRGTQDKTAASAAQKQFIAAQNAADESAKAAEKASVAPLANALADAIAQATHPAK